MPLVLELDLRDLERATVGLELDGERMRRAAQAAANRVVRWARLQIQRGLAARLGIPQGALKSRVKALTAGKGRRQAAVWIALRPLNLAKIGARRTRQGLRAAGKEFGGAFLARGRYGGTVAMRRRGEARTPLEGVSIAVRREAVPLIELRAWPELQEQFLRLYRIELERRRSKP